MSKVLSEFNQFFYKSNDSYNFISLIRDGDEYYQELYNGCNIDKDSRNDMKPKKINKLSMEEYIAILEYTSSNKMVKGWEELWQEFDLKEKVDSMSIEELEAELL